MIKGKPRKTAKLAGIDVGNQHPTTRAFTGRNVLSYSKNVIHDLVMMQKKMLLICSYGFVFLKLPLQTVSTNLFSFVHCMSVCGFYRGNKFTIVCK